jgi:hypothetical protein
MKTRIEKDRGDEKPRIKTEKETHLPASAVLLSRGELSEKHVVR